MEVITIRDQIRSVARRFRRTYETSLDTPAGWKPGKTRRDIADDLNAIDVEAATREDVAQIIGNESWVGLKCHECGEDTDIVIQLGEPMDYESQTAHVCPVCISEAFGRIQRHGPR